MTNKRNEDFELAMNIIRLDKTNKRLFVIVILLIVSLIGSNAGWLYYESQFVDEKIVIEAEQQADGDSENLVIGGDYNAGQTESNSNEDNQD